MHDIAARRARMLDKDTLLSPLKISLTNIEMHDTTVYNVLFTDSASGLVRDPEK